MPDSICEELTWDSSFFGLRVARLKPSRLTAGDLSEALQWCTLHEINCLYFLADPDHRETARLAEDAGFQLVDIRVTLTHSAGSDEDGETPDQRIRLFRDSDLEPLKAIARVSHRDSRFFFDESFRKERAEALYETWIERSCGGWASAVFVAELNGLACGYCSCHLDDGAGRIGLIALAPHAQGQSLGSHLVAAAMSYFRKQGIAKVSVATQGRNVRAQRLYQHCGFATDSMMLWYHKWFRKPAGSGR
jgi:dTDP-4-amino-4,6-dideoxy-D-galactose acyltransferase